MSDFAEYKELIMADRVQNKEDHKLLFTKIDKLTSKVDDLLEKLGNIKGSINVWQIIFRSLTTLLIIDKIIDFFKGAH